MNIKIVKPPFLIWIESLEDLKKTASIFLGQGDKSKRIISENLERVLDGRESFCIGPEPMAIKVEIFYSFETATLYGPYTPSKHLWMIGHTAVRPDSLIFHPEHYLVSML